MRLKNKKENKSENIFSRCTEKEKAKVLTKAMFYCEGNISEWVLHASLNYIPNKKDIKREGPPKRTPKNKAIQ